MIVFETWSQLINNLYIWGIHLDTTTKLQPLEAKQEQLSTLPKSKKSFQITTPAIPTKKSTSVSRKSADIMNKDSNTSVSYLKRIDITLDAKRLQLDELRNETALFLQVRVS